MSTYTVILEQGPTSWGAYVPDLPGCVAVGETLEEIRQLIGEAIAFYIEELRRDGRPIPHAASHAELIKHA